MATTDNATLLWDAAYNGRLDEVKELIATSVDLNSDEAGQGTALYAASGAGHYEIVELLLAHGADPNICTGKSANALQAAAINGSSTHTRIAELLIAHGADVNAQSGSFGNALQAAAVTPTNKDLVRILLKHGADPNTSSGMFGCALQAAADGEGNDDIIELLLDYHGANVNQVGENWGTALQVASEAGFESTVLLLLSRGADPNIVAGFHGTALEAAAYRGFRRIVDILLEHGADVDIQGGARNNAIEAARTGHDGPDFELADFLQSRSKLSSVERVASAT